MFLPGSHRSSCLRVNSTTCVSKRVHHRPPDSVFAVLKVGGQRTLPKRRTAQSVGWRHRLTNDSCWASQGATRRNQGSRNQGSDIGQSREPRVPGGIEHACERGMDIVTLQPHTSHRLQPLDVAVFASVKTRYRLLDGCAKTHHSGQRVTTYDV